VSQGVVKRGTGKRGSYKEREARDEGGRGSKILFWNIEGLGRQDIEFWNFIKEWDFVSLSETWLEENG